MKRLLGTATAAALLMTGPISATAMAQEDDPVATGVGTGKVSSTLLGIDIGQLLQLDLLDDLGLSTIDPTNGEPLAEGVFNPLKLTSTVLGDMSVGGIATSSTGDEDTESVTDPLAGSNIPVPIVSGLLEGTLSSVVDGEGASSSLLAGLGELELVGGLLGMDASPDAVSFETNAAAANAGGVRGLDTGPLELLNLGNLLEGIGLPLGNLPLIGGEDGLTSITGLLGGLGIDSVPVVGQGDMPTDDVISSITGLTGVLGLLSDDVPTDPLSSEDCAEVDGLLTDLPILGGTGGIGGLLGLGDCGTLLGLPIGDIPLVGELLTKVTDLLEPILRGGLPLLDDLSLLSVGGITAQMQSTATDSLDTSKADVVAEITSLNVAGLDTGQLPLVGGALNLTQGAGVLAGVGNTISGVLNGALGLDGLLDIDVLDIDEILQPNGDYTDALSSLTALGVNLDPSKILGVGSLQAGGGLPLVGDVLDTLPVGLDGLPLGGEMLGLGGVLDGVTSILTDGLGLEVGQMQSEGFFTPVAALPPSIVPPAAQPVTPPADGNLPRTGADTALPALLAVVLAGAAIGVRQMVRTAKVEI